MLRPHLILTIVVCAVLGALFMRLVTEHRASVNGPTPTLTPSPPSAGSTSGDRDTIPDIGPHSTTTPASRPSGPMTIPNNDDGDRTDYDEPRSGGNEARGPNAPGQFDYYALVLSWSPTYCAEKGDQGDPMQCSRRDGRRYGFIMHGLWPQYDRGYPEQCDLGRRPFVPDNVISRMLDIMPSRGLVIHEYRTHGTCSGLDPDRYFSLAHRLFDGIKIPTRFLNPTTSQTASPDEIRSDFQRANPSLASNMIAIICGGGQLREVRLCLSKDGRPRACGSNEDSRRTCSQNRVSIPPARAATSNDFGGDGRRPY